MFKRVSCSTVGIRVGMLSLSYGNTIGPVHTSLFIGFQAHAEVAQMCVYIFHRSLLRTISSIMGAYFGLPSFPCGEKWACENIILCLCPPFQLLKQFDHWALNLVWTLCHLRLLFNIIQLIITWWKLVSVGATLASLNIDIRKRQNGGCMKYILWRIDPLLSGNSVNSDRR
jgi:hypothetical protein